MQKLHPSWYLQYRWWGFQEIYWFTGLGSTDDKGWGFNIGAWYVSIELLIVRSTGFRDQGFELWTRICDQHTMQRLKELWHDGIIIIPSLFNNVKGFGCLRQTGESMAMEHAPLPYWDSRHAYFWRNLTIFGIIFAYFSQCQGVYVALFNSWSLDGPEKAVNAPRWIYALQKWLEIDEKLQVKLHN